jgi:hypothetical protein
MPGRLHRDMHLDRREVERMLDANRAALTSERPYKRPWPVEEAVAYIRDQSGSHFEPRIVEHFLVSLPEILAIGECFAEPEVCEA